MKKKKLMSVLALTLAVLVSMDGVVCSVSAQTLKDAMDATGAQYGEAIAVAVDATDAIDETEAITVSEDDLSASLMAEATYSTSGAKRIAKMSKNAIANNLNAIYSKSYPLMAIPTGTVYPFSTGTPSAEHLKYGLVSVNLMRQIAGLPGVTLDDRYNTLAQYGAAYCAITGLFQHGFDPSTMPGGMSQDFYEKANKGASSSNLSKGSSTYYTMPKFTIGYMQDNSGSNVATVGHRRWVLNPDMAKTGLGYAVGSSGSALSAMYVFDETASTPDYDFIAWPSSGNFPNNLMSAGDPWSIQFNPSKFKINLMDESTVTVTITAPNGVTKTFTAADTSTSLNDKSASYYRVEGDTAIIFRPGTAIFGSDPLNGTYTVVVSGVKDNVNAPATVCYTVDFFNPDDYVTEPGKDIDDINKVVDETAVTNFVTRLYSKCLDRGGDSEGILYWKDELISGNMTGAVAAQGFFFSDEMKLKNLNDEQFLEVLYNVMMNRKSDEAGRAYWLSLMESGIGRTGIFAEFAVSPEFTNICKEYGITRGAAVITEGRDKNMGATQFIARLYTKALGRTYDVDGLNYWCNCLVNKNYTAAEIATSQFFHSKEFTMKNLGDSDYVKVLYRTFMGREFDQDGLDYWLFQMRVFGMSRDQVLNNFAASEEFRLIMAGYGL